MLKKTNVSELNALTKAEMDIVTGGNVPAQGKQCDICQFTKREKAKKELADKSQSSLEMSAMDINLF